MTKLKFKEAKKSAQGQMMDQIHALDQVLSCLPFLLSSDDNRPLLPAGSLCSSTAPTLLPE